MDNLLDKIRERERAEDPGVDWDREHAIWYRHDVAFLLSELRVRDRALEMASWDAQYDGPVRGGTPEHYMSQARKEADNG